MKRILNGLVAFTMLFSIGFLAALSFAEPVYGYDDIIKHAGVSSGDNANAEEEVAKELGNWITRIKGFGIVWTVLMIVVAGIIMSSSLGSAQRRTLGTSALLMAAVGLLVIGNASTIANYFI